MLVRQTPYQVYEVAPGLSDTEIYVYRALLRRAFWQSDAGDWGWLLRPRGFFICLEDDESLGPTALRLPTGVRRMVDGHQVNHHTAATGAAGACPSPVG